MILVFMSNYDYDIVLIIINIVNIISNRHNIVIISNNYFKAWLLIIRLERCFNKAKFRETKSLQLPQTYHDSLLEERDERHKLEEN